MRLIRFVALALVGCSAPDKSEDSAGSGEADTASVAPTDEDVLRAAISGETSASEALSLVFDSGGFPVVTASGTHLFACLCGDGDWLLAGDHDGWTGAPMTRSGELWWIEVAIESPDGSFYKFTDGDTWIADPLSRRYAYDEFGENSLVDASFGHLERGLAAAAQGLDERMLRIWVPAGGDFTHALYVHDGQNLFDPSAFHGGWQLDRAIGARSLLVVGLDNTPARIDEYTHTTDVIDGQTFGGLADDYGALVADVRVQMEARYGAADTTGLMGSSLGGLVSLLIADAQPGDWDAALSLSGTMGWGSIGAENETVLDRYAAAGLRDTAIFLDSGGGGSCTDSDGDGLQDDAPDGQDNYCENRQLADQLAADGYTWDTDLWHWHEPGAPHTEAAWAARVDRPIGIFLGL